MNIHWNTLQISAPTNKRSTVSNFISWLEKLTVNKINNVFQLKADYREQDTDMFYCSCDLDLDQMTLTYEPDLDVLKLYLHTKN